MPRIKFKKEQKEEVCVVAMTASWQTWKRRISREKSIEFWVGVLQNLKPDCSSLFLWQVSGVTQANTPPPQHKQTHAVPPTVQRSLSPPPAGSHHRCHAFVPDFSTSVLSACERESGVCQIALQSWCSLDNFLNNPVVVRITTSDLKLYCTDLCVGVQCHNASYWLNVWLTSSWRKKNIWCEINSSIEVCEMV